MNASRGSAGQPARMILALLLSIAALLAIGAGSAMAASQPVIESESGAEVTSGSATLRARINPKEADTTYYFQYGTVRCAAHLSSCTDLPAAPGVDLGQGAEGLSVSVLAANLAPSTTYDYRVVANNEAGESAGAEKTFTTQGTATEFRLPDGRIWEMVTPPNKQGAGIIAQGNEQGDDVQAAEDGTGITFGATSSFVENPAGNNSPEVTQVLSTRTVPGAWTSQDITTPHNEGATELAIGHSAEYKLFSANLEFGAVEPMGHTPLPPLPAGSEKTVYLRTASGEYMALVSAANTIPGAKFGGNGEGAGGIKFELATPDFSRVVVSANTQLTETPVASEAQRSFLYLWSGGHLQAVSMMPNGEEVSAHLGYFDGVTSDMRHAISADGSRVVWVKGYGNGHIYLRDVTRGETVQVDAAQGIAEPKAIGSHYVTANDSDSRIFFTSNQPLTANSTAGEEKVDLYEYEVTSGPNAPLAGKLTDLTVDSNAGQHADVQGVIEAGGNGSYVYFVANGVLGDAAERGAVNGDCSLNVNFVEGRTCNLYVEHFNENAGIWSSPTYIATLSGPDFPSWRAAAYGNLTYLTSRVSPNGRYLAFMSDLSLTGYDTRDAQSGMLDEEVYLYDASTQKLVCASCNPTGGQPIGLHEGNGYEENLVDYAKIWQGRWFAANVPGWDSRDLSSALYQPRYLANNGRLFFNSADALVPADVNGTEDVYEYEPARVDGCQPPTYGQSGSVVYSEAVGGCVALISQGTSTEESAFMDASSSGGDVFFQTLSQLVPKDHDSSIDIYDAHECTQASPCVPVEAVAPPPCTSSDACREAPSPQPAVFGAPASATFSGAGEPTPPVISTTPRKNAGARQKLERALKRCASEFRHEAHKRSLCERKARRRLRGRKLSHGRTRGGVRQASAGRESGKNGSKRRGR
jgi:hypothetical protein